MAIEGIIGRKVGMTQVYAEDGRAIPATVIQAGPCVVVQRKSRKEHTNTKGQKQDGRLRGGAARAWSRTARSRRSPRPRPATSRRRAATCLRCKVLREFRVEDGDEAKVGDKVSVEHVRRRRHRQHRRARARARASRAWSSATTSAAARPRTARCSTARPAPSAPRPSPRASSRACGRPATWAPDRVTQRNMTVVRVDAENEHPGRQGCRARRGRRVRGDPEEGIGQWPRRRRPTRDGQGQGQGSAARRRRTRSRTPTPPTWAPPPATSPRRPIDVVNTNNEKVSNIVLHPDVFRVAREQAPALRGGEAVPGGSARAGTHATKNRALVSGSGKKPWRQKGTGRARVGETRTPLWRHGGTVFGPQPRDYSYDMPKKARAAALRSALSQRAQDGGAQGHRPLRHRAAEDEGAEGASSSSWASDGQDAGRGQQAGRQPRSSPGATSRA